MTINSSEKNTKKGKKGKKGNKGKKRGGMENRPDKHNRMLRVDRDVLFEVLELLHGHGQKIVVRHE